MQSHPLHRTHFGQYQTSSAVLGWPGDGNCCCMQEFDSLVAGLICSVGSSTRVYKICRPAKSQIFMKNTRSTISSLILCFVSWKQHSVPHRAVVICRGCRWLGLQWWWWNGRASGAPLLPTSAGTTRKDSNTRGIVSAWDASLWSFPWLRLHA